MIPSAAAPAPIDARNAGSTAVIISWLKSLKSDARPRPNRLRVIQRVFMTYLVCYPVMVTMVSATSNVPMAYPT